LPTPTSKANYQIGGAVGLVTPTRICPLRDHGCLRTYTVDAKGKEHSHCPAIVLDQQIIEGPDRAGSAGR
jgi:hypothetical protein